MIDQTTLGSKLIEGYGPIKDLCSMHAFHVNHIDLSGRKVPDEEATKLGPEERYNSLDALMRAYDHAVSWNTMYELYRENFEETDDEKVELVFTTMKQNVNSLLKMGRECRESISSIYMGLPDPHPDKLE